MFDDPDHHTESVGNPSLMQANAVVFHNEAKLTWTVVDSVGDQKRSLVEIKTKQGALIRRFEGSSIGLGKSRAVIFSVPTTGLKADLKGVEVGDAKFVDLIRAPTGIHDVGVVRAEMYKPEVAVQLSNLARQERETIKGSATNAAYKLKIQEVSKQCITFNLNVTDLAESLKHSPSNSMSM